MAHQFTTSYLADADAVLRNYKAMAERAMAQVSDDQLLEALDTEGNSIAVIVKHIAGNLRSRYTEFLSSDGEKPERRRDLEFETPPATRDELLAMWERGWQCVFGTFEQLKETDLTRTITIRSEPHSVMQAINRTISHSASHIGQIVFLAKHLKASEWRSLSVPRGKSDEFNRKMATGDGSQR
ncbi:MAG: DUF1572 family protein [Bryobacteraceae bacterium]